MLSLGTRNKEAAKDRDIYRSLQANRMGCDAAKGRPFFSRVGGPRSPQLFRLSVGSLLPSSPRARLAPSACRLKLS